MDGVMDVARPKARAKRAKASSRLVTGVLVKNMQHVLTVRVPLGERAVDVSYFVEDITDGQVASGARPVSVTLCDPDTPPTEVRIPPEQMATIEARIKN